jgi:hypothetical protein
MVLTGYSDSDLAGDRDDSKSTSGLMFFLGSSPVSWQSQKQRVVALSSCEAKYIAAATASCQGLWLSRLIADLLNKEVASPMLYIDNKAAIAHAKNPGQFDRCKHIQIRYHFLRDCVNNGSLRVDHVSTTDQLADMLTKPLPRDVFKNCATEVAQLMLIPSEALAFVCRGGFYSFYLVYRTHGLRGRILNKSICASREP